MNMVEYYNQHIMNPGPVSKGASRHERETAEEMARRLSVSPLTLSSSPFAPIVSSGDGMNGKAKHEERGEKEEEEEEEEVTEFDLTFINDYESWLENEVFSLTEDDVQEEGESFQVPESMTMMDDSEASNSSTSGVHSSSSDQEEAGEATDAGVGWDSEEPF